MGILFAEYISGDYQQIIVYGLFDKGSAAAAGGFDKGVESAAWFC